MRILPCLKNCAGQPALARKTPPLYQTLGTMHGPSLRYPCKRCGRMSVLMRADFLRLPLMTLDELRAKTCDMTPTKEDEEYLAAQQEALSAAASAKPSA